MLPGTVHVLSLGKSCLAVIYGEFSLSAHAGLCRK